MAVDNFLRMKNERAGGYVAATDASAQTQTHARTALISNREKVDYLGTFERQPHVVLLELLLFR